MRVPSDQALTTESRRSQNTRLQVGTAIAIAVAVLSVATVAFLATAKSLADSGGGPMPSIEDAGTPLGFGEQPAARQGRGDPLAVAPLPPGRVAALRYF
jgi:hypothetical protein